MKSQHLFPSGLIVDVDITKLGYVAVHKALDAASGYTLTYVDNHKVMAWAPLKSTAMAWRKQVEKAIEDGRDDEYLRWLLHFMSVNG